MSDSWDEKKYKYKIIESTSSEKLNKLNKYIFMI